MTHFRIEYMSNYNKTDEYGLWKDLCEHICMFETLPREVLPFRGFLPNPPVGTSTKKVRVSFRKSNSPGSPEEPNYDEGSDSDDLRISPEAIEHPVNKLAPIRESKRSIDSKIADKVVALHKLEDQIAEGEETRKKIRLEADKFTTQFLTRAERYDALFEKAKQVWATWNGLMAELKTMNEESAQISNTI